MSSKSAWVKWHWTSVSLGLARASAAEKSPFPVLPQQPWEGICPELLAPTRQKPQPDEPLWKDRDPQWRGRSIWVDIVQDELGSQLKTRGKPRWNSLALGLARKRWVSQGWWSCPGEGLASQHGVWLACSPTAPYWKVSCQGVKWVAFKLFFTMGTNRSQQGILTQVWDQRLAWTTSSNPEACVRLLKVTDEAR